MHYYGLDIPTYLLFYRISRHYQIHSTFLFSQCVPDGSQTRTVRDHTHGGIFVQSHLGAFCLPRYTKRDKTLWEGHLAPVRLPPHYVDFPRYHMSSTCKRRHCPNGVRYVCFCLCCLLSLLPGVSEEELFVYGAARTILRTKLCASVVPVEVGPRSLHYTSRLGLDIRLNHLLPHDHVKEPVPVCLHSNCGFGFNLRSPTTLALSATLAQLMLLHHADR